MTSYPSPQGELRLGLILEAAGLDFDQTIVLRHTFTDAPDGLKSFADITPAKVLDYTRRQVIVNKLGKHPPFLWLVFLADGGRRSRFLGAYENHGEVTAERNDVHRFFDLRPCDVLGALADRLVIEWSADPVNWAKPGQAAAAFRVVEVVDRQVVKFPGFDRLLLTHAELKDVLSDPRYEPWCSALRAVQGIYLIADESSGQLYVGKADGRERILGRWSAYARDGQGGNAALKTLAGLDPTHSRHFRYSILRVFDPSVAVSEVAEAESHFKRALLTRQYGLNRN